MSTRLDSALAARGLARSRSHAATLIADGLVSVDGRTVVKASHPVSDTATLVVAGADHYVSRAAHKLIAGLDAFGIAVAERAALDMGASTGGFTQVLRERGARPVVAVDVGHGQLSPAIAADDGVIVVEGFNVRDLSPEAVSGFAGGPFRPDIITGDLSFISLEHVLPAVVSVCASTTDVILLVKPQFEVGRTAVKGGLVTDPALRADAVMSVLWSAWDAGLATRGVIASPIAGTHGNQEYVVHLCIRVDDTGNPTQWIHTVDELAGAR
ncbi:23S rRNA (cytidine1920-2'-O)/16S rRNA (cytidine1409-2'-O)-methyltransferase [Microbacterium paludicola]|uniref:23S rRNA (Cytidine1920-2'-O)/16S rRNA (Cytidine1409-2'-O)-methyltransferase n=1 Tax=Microbacterium paludicola TaxID=300019 RepID=A0ABU1I0B5_9MICO|nr:TlyA family RNA methyltransferase [Microbacterium paludicola]MDR6167335.1 23S rRNA (cytidine1920-2'-O)/16S rRNA (cytidine1409-2'-O)-methyltransferase [Microbacterium paludicola]